MEEGAYLRSVLLLDTHLSRSLLILCNLRREQVNQLVLLIHRLLQVLNDTKKLRKFGFMCSIQRNRGCLLLLHHLQLLLLFLLLCLLDEEGVLLLLLLHKLLQLLLLLCCLSCLVARLLQLLMVVADRLLMLLQQEALPLLEHTHVLHCLLELFARC